MRNFVILLVLCLCYQIQYSRTGKIDRYLDNQADIVSKRLSRHVITSAKDSVEVTFRERKSLATFHRHQGTQVGGIFTNSNSSFVHLDGDLYKVSPGSSRFQLKTKSQVDLIKAVEFNNHSLIFTTGGSRAEARIYSFSNKPELVLIQTIENSNISDAHFFTNRHELYLIIANNLSKTTLYKFSGSHFNELQKIATTGAFKILSFSTVENSEIVIILQNPPNRHVSSPIFEFKFDKMKKIQKIDTNKPRNILSYISEKTKRFVVIFEGDENDNKATLYSWTGSELLFWEEFSILPTNQQIVMYTNNITTPFIAASTPNASLIVISLNNHEVSPIIQSEYQTNFSKLITIHNYDKSGLVLMGVKENDTISLDYLNVDVEIGSDIESEEDEEEILVCLSNVETTAYRVRAKIAEIKNQSSARSSESPRNPLEIKANRTISDISKLTSRMSNLQVFLDDNYNKLSEDSDSLVVGGAVVLEKSLNGGKVIGNDIRFHELNGRKWAPDELLSYSKPQTITGQVKAKSLKIKRLHAVHSTLFENLALNGNNDQTWTGKIEIRDLLKVDDLRTGQINKIPAETIYDINEKSQKITSGVKTFKNLRIKNAQVQAFNDKDESEIISAFINPNLSNKFIFSPNLRVDDLIVDSIDDIAWEEFNESVFKIGETETITGNLFFGDLVVKNASFSRIGEVPTDQLLTKSTDQTISSSFKVNTIFAQNINARTVNNVTNFGENVATLTETGIIEGPVRISNVTVLKDLEMNEPLHKNFLIMEKNHIVGTNESDLLQIYNGKVVIKGDLYLRNISILRGSRISVNGDEFDLKEVEKYWSKSREQIIPSHFETDQVSTPHLYTKFLNGEDINDYLLNFDREGRKPTKFVFENVSISGELILLDDYRHVPDFKKIQEESVKTTGRFEISGTKTYKENVKIENLEANQVDGIDVTKIFNDKLSNKIFNEKSIKNLIVEGNLSTDSIKVDNINQINLNKLMNDTIFINQRQEINELDFENLSVKRLTVDKINDYRLDSHISKIRKLVKAQHLDKLIISGSVTIKDAVNVSKINEHDVETLLNSGLQYRNKTVYGRVKFIDSVKINDLVVDYINDVDFLELTSRILSKNWRQIITKPYTFRRIKADNLVAFQINNITIKNIVDISSKEPQTIVVPGGLRISKSKIENLSGDIGCNLAETLSDLRTPPNRAWRKLEVLGDLILWDSESDLSDIFENIVRNNTDNKISGKVTFSQHTCAGSITTARNINGINIQEIVEDALLINSDEEQVITGRKTLSKLVANSAIASQMNTNTINGIDLEEIDSKIINSSFRGVIRGRKIFFEGLQTDKFETEMISSMRPEDLVSLDDDRRIPGAIFDSIEISDNLNVNFVNFMPINKIFSERVLLRSDKPQEIDGDYTFINDVNIGNVITPHINDIDLDDVVFDDGYQIINAPKKFTNVVKVVGDVKVDYINGFAISEIYERAILNEPTQFQGNLVFSSPSTINGNITTISINNFPVSYMLEIVNTSVIATEVKEMEKIKERMQNFIYKYFNKASNISSAYLYLEKSNDMQISIADSLNAQAVETKGDVLVHIEGQESGESCGLPTTCKCPIQHTIQISQEKSVYSFINKGFQRIYSYYDDDVMAHLITNSISTKSECRSEPNKTLNEVSYMTWSTTPQNIRQGAFHMHKEMIVGYISGVEFFTIGNDTYVVIGKYYDPVRNTHDLDCTVLKFTEQKTKMKEIQRIPGVEIGALSLFYTSQGVVLIIGSSRMTKILSFDRKTEQFLLLRELPLFSPISITGVTMEEDSLIVLADNQRNLQVLKYAPEYNNYYFYQSLQMNDQILGVSVFYATNYGISQDAFLCVVTENDKFFIYEFKFVEGLKLEATGQMDGIKALVPLKINGKPYLLAPSSELSSLLTVVEYNSN